MRYCLLVLLLTMGFAGTAQVKKTTAPKAKVPLPKSSAGKGGHQIDITLTPLKNCKIYLGSYLGSGKALVDSAMLDANSKGVFKGPNKFTGGVYFIVSPQLTIQFELLMDDVQQFSIVADTTRKDSPLITGSKENDIFKQYTQFSAEKGAELQRLEEAFKKVTNPTDSLNLLTAINSADKALQDYRADIMKNQSGSLLAMLFNTMKRPSAPAIPIVNGKADSTYPFRYVKEHFWDDVLFNDDRLLRTPFFDRKLDDYFKYYVSPEADSIIEEVKYMLLFARTGKEIYPYLLTKFTNKYMTPEFMGQDKVFVYIFENFYAKGDTTLLAPASRKTVRDRAYSLMANQLGQPAPILELTDTLGRAASLYNTKGAFTLVVFWDPNCGHCKEEIPRIDSFYRAKWKAEGLALYGVNIYENEIPAWKKFIQEKKLEGWTHAYQTREAKEADARANRANYRQLYDIYKTPTLYLLDKDKRILAKQLSLEQFDDLINLKLKQSH